MSVKYKPDNYSNVIPYLLVENAAQLIDFLVAVFDGEVNERIEMADGTVSHAEVRIGDSLVMMGQPQDAKNQPTSLYVYVPDTDATYKKALAAGAISTMEPANQFYGDRNAAVKDPFGNSWWIATHIEDISPEEMQRRAKEREKN